MKKQRLFTFTLIIATLASTLFPLAKANAAVDYNRIIDNAVFDNSGAMNASQIDAFLNSFPNSCISPNNGFSSIDPIGYTPAAKFKYGAFVSAGTVIAHAAQAYGINPQVLLATLQKEQGLVVGDGGNVIRSQSNPKDCGALAISASMGYNCPDSMHLTTYNNINIYAMNGTPVTSVTKTCVEHANYVGFSQQITIAAWQLTFDRHRSEGQNNWYASGVSGWDNSDDLGFCYSGRTISGGPFYLCPDQNSHASDPYLKHDGKYVIDSSVVTIQNGPTAAFYNYTPHLHGQELFFNFFTKWFGSPFANCSYPSNDGSSVFRAVQPNTNSQFLTTDPGEICTTTGKMNFKFDGTVFSNISGGAPVYRLNKNGNYLYTASAGERDGAITNYGFKLEGIAFYGGASSSVSTPMAVYRLSYPPTGGYAYTVSSAERDSLVKLGYHTEGVAFYTNNTLGNSLSDIYRMSHPNSGYLYTGSDDEKTSSTTYGFKYEGVAFRSRMGFSTDSLPVYRLAGPHGYFYTADFGERKAAMALGYRAEGIGYYAYPSDFLGATVKVYRLVKNGTYLYTASSAERDYAAQHYGYRYEGVAFRIP